MVEVGYAGEEGVGKLYATWRVGLAEEFLKKVPQVFKLRSTFLFQPTESALHHPHFYLSSRSISSLV
jgi:hypothetical protein